MELSPDILQLYTVKLILQPLVENAIYHGIKESETPGLIAISGRRSGSVMELRVTDNGPGIPPERLAMLQADLARGLSVSGEEMCIRDRFIKARPSKSVVFAFG